MQQQQQHQQLSQQPQAGGNIYIILKKSAGEWHVMAVFEEIWLLDVLPGYLQQLMARPNGQQIVCPPHLFVSPHTSSVAQIYHIYTIIILYTREPLAAPPFAELLLQKHPHLVTTSCCDINPRHNGVNVARTPLYRLVILWEQPFAGTTRDSYCNHLWQHLNLWPPLAATTRDGVETMLQRRVTPVASTCDAPLEDQLFI